MTRVRHRGGCGGGRRRTVFQCPLWRMYPQPSHVLIVDTDRGRQAQARAGRRRPWRGSGHDARPRLRTAGRQPRSLGGLAGNPQMACRCRKATASRSEAASIALPQSGQRISAGIPWLIRRCASIQLAAFSSGAGSRQSGQCTQSISAAEASRKGHKHGTLRHRPGRARPQKATAQNAANNL